VSARESSSLRYFKDRRERERERESGVKEGENVHGLFVSVAPSLPVASLHGRVVGVLGMRNGGRTIVEPEVRPELA
jgi:hypothetical protein